jgi:RND family efflux transporter MFP subunit
MCPAVSFHSMISMRTIPKSLLLAVVAPILLASCGGTSESEAGETEIAVLLTPQDVATAVTDSVETGPMLTGSLEPAERVTLRAQVAGTIDAVRVDRGSRVNRGQTLAVVEAAGIRGAAAGAQAAVAAAQANVALARQRLEAARTLYTAGATSRIDLQSAEAAFEAAEAQLAAARAQSASAGEAAGNTIITSPLTGVVSDRMVEAGESVNPGTELFTVVNAQQLELAGQVPVDAAARVRVGQPVRFTLQAEPDRELRGEVARIDPTADPQTRRVGLYVRLENPGNRIIGGQFARGRIVGDRVAAVVVPQTAVRQEGQMFYVLVIENDRIARREVTVMATDEARGISGVDGVRAGEQVIIAPGAQIAPGTLVTVGGDQPIAPARDTSTEGR